MENTMSDSIRELYGELKQGVSASKDYAEYLKALGELDREMAALMEPDEHGWKMLDARRMEALAKKYRMAGMLAEVYLQNTRDSKDPAEQQLRSKVRKVSELMAADTAALRRYNPKSERELKSLPTVLEEARIPVMDQSSKVIKSVGGAQSSRFPMTIIGPDGKPMPGMFTKADVFDPKGMMTGLLNRAAAKAGPAGAALLSGFLEAYQSYYTQNQDEAHPVSPAPEQPGHISMEPLPATRLTALPPTSSTATPPSTFPRLRASDFPISASRACEPTLARRARTTPTTLCSSTPRRLPMSAASLTRRARPLRG